MRSGKAKLSEWQGVVKVVKLDDGLIMMLILASQFTFHAAMLYDALEELNQAGRLTVVKRVRQSAPISRLLIPNLSIALRCS